MSLFLQNPHAPELISDLMQWMAVEHPPDHEIYAIADMTMLDANWLRQLERLASPTITILEHSRYAAYEELGPRLISLENLLPNQLERLLRWANGTPSLSFVELVSPSGKPDLKPLVWLAETEIENGLPLYCRYADTRILPPLLSQLGPVQTPVLASRICRWAWINREGRLDETTWIKNKDNIEPPIFPLQLDQRQFAELMRAAEADLIFNLVHESAPEIIPKAAPAEIHRRLSALLDAGRQRGVEDASDQHQFVAIAWSSSETFYQLPCLEPTWEMLSQHITRFADVIKTWSDNVWDQIDALSPASQCAPS